MIALLLTALLLQAPTVKGVVLDSTGATIAAATVTVTAGDRSVSTTTGPDGRWMVTLPAAGEEIGIRVSAPGFAVSQTKQRVTDADVTTELRPERIAEQITVSAESAAARLSIDSSVTSIDRSSIAAAPALRLDDQLRQVPGFSLFRRTSSAVANPTTQGVTLRGLSASGASRTLVVSDDVPLNDPFGGWVYWDRIPLAAVQRVDVLRGGSGDIHGNDALGGVIKLTTRTTNGAEAWLDAGSADGGRASLYGGMANANMNAGASAEWLTTDGYVVVAPESRGTIDVPAYSEATSTMGWIGTTHGAFAVTARGGYFDENRGNGTPAQINTTITRWGGATAHGALAGGIWEARGDFSATNYHQTFSAVAAGRATERLTNVQWVGGSGGGFGASWLRQGSRVEGLIAYSSRAADADLDEGSFSLTGVPSAITRTRAQQRGDGVIGQVRFTVNSKLSLDAGARADFWRLKNLAAGSTPSDVNFFEPRAGATVQFTPDTTLRVTWLSGFRTPTMNELYRSFRVGNTMTNANAGLGPEESKGPEVAFTMRRNRWTARAIAYATWLDGAIYNRTISSTPTLIVRERTNGDAQTYGSELELEWRATRELSVTSAWAFNNATFTAGELDGKRVPQVPKASGSIGMRALFGAFSGTATFRYIGAQYDDDRNDFELRDGALVDARAGWRPARRLELFAAIENAFDAEIDTGRTPIRTVGSPRLWRAGLTVRY